MTSHMTCHVMSRTAKNKLSKSKKSRANPCQAMPGTAKQCLGKAKERSCSCLGNVLRRKIMFISRKKVSQSQRSRARDNENEKLRGRFSGFPRTFHSPNCCKPEPLDPRSFRENTFPDKMMCPWLQAECVRAGSRLKVVLNGAASGCRKKHHPRRTHYFLGTATFAFVVFLSGAAAVSELKTCVERRTFFPRRAA